MTAIAAVLMKCPATFRRTVPYDAAAVADRRPRRRAFLAPELSTERRAHPAVPLRRVRRHLRLDGASSPASADFGPVAAERIAACAATDRPDTAMLFSRTRTDCIDSHHIIALCGA